MADLHGETRASADMGEHLRTWRMFISMIKWNLLGAAALLLLLLAFRTHS
jgi:Bacterial aa3 type cytochrome c oxidase subunit IV